MKKKTSFFFVLGYTKYLLKKQLYFLYACRLSFVLQIFSLSIAYPQQPGGVSGTKVWYVSVKEGNRNILKDTSGNHWADFKESVGNNINLNINYHPAVYFDGVNADQNLKNFAFSQGTVIGTFYPEEPDYRNRYFFLLDYHHERIGFQYNTVDTNGRIKYTYGSPSNRTNFIINGTSTTKENSMKTAVYYFGSNKLYTSIWGEEKSTDIFSTFKGYIPEFIIYNRVLTPLEKSKIESYLAIKYGTTLDSSYIGKNGTMWDINNSRLKKFHNRICAIGKDTASGLWQPISNTTYEEKPYISFDHDATGLDLRSGWHFIPSFDKFSLYRSITVAYSDTAMLGNSSGDFLFLGDDSLSVLSTDYYTIPSSHFPNLRLVKRNWIVYNQNKSFNPTKIVVAGKDYSKSTLFGNLYKPYDYQHFGFVIAKIDSSKPDNLETTLLSKYFGREEETHNKYHFDTRTIVWDSVYWNNASSYNYFTFGKVPLLNFLQIGKNANVKIKLGFPYNPNGPIETGTTFDTVRFNYKLTDPKTLFFDVNEGVPPLIATLYLKTTTGTLQRIPNAIVNATVVADTSVIHPPIDPNEDENNVPQPHDPSGSLIEYIDRVIRFPEQRPKPIRHNVNFPSLDSTYVIIVKDKIGQVTTIPVTIIKTN